MIGFINTFVYNLSISRSIIALPLTYPFHQSLRKDIRFLATDLSQELSLQMTMKSSCYFLFNHLGMQILQNSSRFSNVNSLLQSSQSQSYITTDGQSVSLSWCQAPIWGLRPDFYYCQTVAGLLMWDALSDERTGLLLQLLLVSPAQSFLGPSPAGLVIIFYCVRFETPPTWRARSPYL
jgi:hypothetical protein